MSSTIRITGKIILFSLTLVIYTNAKTVNTNEKVKTMSNSSKTIGTTYESMTIDELQKAVVSHSEKGDLSFALGQELIKRWTKCEKSKKNLL